MLTEFYSVTWECLLSNGFEGRSINPEKTKHSKCVHLKTVLRFLVWPQLPSRGYMVGDILLSAAKEEHFATSNGRRLRVFTISIFYWSYGIKITNGVTMTARESQISTFIVKGSERNQNFQVY